MKSVMGDETQNTREDVFADYLTYYKQVWPQGDLSICQETEVTEKAKRFLLTESNPDSRFTVFDFYGTVECLTEGRREFRDALRELAKATELLEMLCVNLFLFPWKKEIKTLKTFTGPFVYWIKPVLPQTMVKYILESIGYHPETDMEYRLDKSADPEKATQMGFELFLARQECEYLLEVGQNRPWDFMEILQQRSPQTPQSLCAASESLCAASESLCVQEEQVEESAPAAGENASLQENRDEELDRGHSLVDPGMIPPEEAQPLPGTGGGGAEDSGQCPQSLEFRPPEETVEPDGGQSRLFMTDDRSILEMREHYPDLAFRQKPIFGEQQGQSRQKMGRRTPKGGTVAGSDLSTPSSAVRLPESRPAASVTAVSPKLARRPPEPHAQDKDPVETETHQAQKPASPQGPGPRGAQTMAEASQASEDETIVSELAQRMGQMSVKENRAETDLKFPVEETAWQDEGKASPIGSPRERSQPIMCHPSQVQLCSISSCHACDCSGAPPGDGVGCDTIKEPPQPFYIPPSPEGGPQALVDDLLNTYVMVEHDQK
ncbi:spermatogenesis-associated protein 2-like protein [Conger conger]|uniref:spermatogenesis-associated protein 2-like protein n=1 Tax=Conger conger TaxID=82655 RepID=UPI002A5AA64B|nr:spermatogenesis-associated protein 2-like protein [Conger conger]